MFPGGRTAGLWQWLLHFGRRNRLPLSEGNAVRPLVQGDLILEATRRLIDEATSSLCVEMYIWAPDATGRAEWRRSPAACPWRPAAHG